MTALLSAWQRFAALLSSSESRQLIGTAEAVEGLLVRSSIERAIEQGDSVDFEMVSEADRQYRAAVSELAERTRLGLYGDRQPVTDWWWKVPELALGQEASALVEVRQAADIKGVHPHTIRSAIHTGDLPARRLGRGFLIQRRDLERWTPRSVGRPSKARAKPGDDELLAAFNDANTQGRIEDAHTFADRLELAPSTARRCLAIAIDRYNQRRHEDALAWIERARALGLDEAGEARARLVRGVSLIQLDRAPEAVADLRDLEAPAPFRWQARAALGEALLAADEIDDAERVIDEAIDEEPERGELHYLAARIRFHDDRPVQALIPMLAFRQLAPTDGPGILLHGSILGYLADLTGDDTLYPEALRLFEQVVASEGHVAMAKRGLTYGRLGLWRQALGDAAALSTEGEGDVADRVVRAALHGALERGGATAVIDAARTAERLIRVTIATCAFRAAGHALLGHLDLASKTLAEDQSQGPDAMTEELVLLRALTQIATGDAANAAQSISEQIHQSGPSSHLYVALARAATIAGDEGGAKEALHNLVAMGGALGQVADIAVTLLSKQKPKDMSTAADARSAISSTAVGTPEGEMVHFAWDFGHRLVSRPIERSLNRALPH